MSQRSQTLRALVTERLTAAAEEIFVLVERTIAEYEEELCRSKEENQRKQQLLDSILCPQLVLHRIDAQIQCPEPGLKQEILETPQIKEEPEEQRIKPEEEQLPQFTAVCVKSEEPTEHREEQTNSSSVTDNHDDWEPAADSSAAQTETEADGGQYNQVQIRDTRPAEHNSTLFNKDTSAAETGAAGKRGQHECTICNKRYPTKYYLKQHIRVHTGERPFTCFVCEKKFSQKSNLRVHMRTHTGERAYPCPVCHRAFLQSPHLTKHIRTHTGEKPFTCAVCKKAFNRKEHLNKHMAFHRAPEHQ